MFEKSSRRSTVAAPSINVTPLVDVLLVLLIIFFIIQPQREEKLPVRTPQPAPETEPAPETLMLTLTPDFKLALNSQPVKLDELKGLLSDLMDERPVDARVLFIKAPNREAYESVVFLVDIARGAGVITVGLLSDEG